MYFLRVEQLPLGAEDAGAHVQRLVPGVEVGPQLHRHLPQVVRGNAADPGYAVLLEATFVESDVVEGPGYAARDQEHRHGHGEQRGGQPVLCLNQDFQD